MSFDTLLLKQGLKISWLDKNRFFITALLIEDIDQQDNPQHVLIRPVSELSRSSIKFFTVLCYMLIIFLNSAVLSFACFQVRKHFSFSIKSVLQSILKLPTHNVAIEIL